MTFPKTWFWILNGGLGGMVLVAGCSSQTSHKWLTVFFDGVPATPVVASPTPSEHLQLANSDWPPIWSSPPAIGSLPGDHPPVENQPVVHKPFAERNCTACHASNYSQRMKGEVSSVCTACHKEFLSPARFAHAPLVDGQCTLCHEPHQAKEKFLLVKNSRELCFDCHELENVSKTKACAVSEGRSCTECHDPHQEERKFLLRAVPGDLPPARKKTPEK